MNLFSHNSMNAPWGLDSRYKLAKAARIFFDPTKSVQNCKVIDKVPENHTFFTTQEFLIYLEKQNIFDIPPNAFRIMHLLNKMVTTGLLYKLGGSAFLGEYFLYLRTTDPHTLSEFGLIQFLGAEFLYSLMNPYIVQITGKGKNGARQGESVAGTGFILDVHHIITCRHVVCDMVVDQQQTFQGITCEVLDRMIHIHEKNDLAVIRVDQALQPVAGMVWQSPVVGQTVYALGYPQIPFTRHDPPLTLHSGAVISEAVELFSGESQFLYSAIARPGQSGGPIISTDGYMVGIVSKDLTYGCSVKSEKLESENIFAPYYAGVSSSVVFESLQELQLGVNIFYQEFT